MPSAHQQNHQTDMLTLSLHLIVKMDMKMVNNYWTKSFHIGADVKSKDRTFIFHSKISVVKYNPIFSQNHLKNDEFSILDRDRNELFGFERFRRNL